MIVPGSANPLLMAQSSDPLDEFGKIERSLRLRSVATAFLGRTPGVTGDRTKWTWSAWVKRGAIASGCLFSAYTDGNNRTLIRLNASHKLDLRRLDGGVSTGNVSSTVYRDSASHLHVHVAVDTTQGAAANRAKAWVNGVAVSFETSDFAASSGIVNLSGAIHGMASNIAGADSYFDGNLSCVAFFDGQALDPISVGQFHPRTGQWRPKSRSAIKAVVDAGGANSFFLPFDDTTNTTTLCTDASSKGNNWTAANISLTAGATYDSMLDTPTNNFPTINPIMQEGTTYGSSLAMNGNLSQNCVATNYDQTVATFGASTGKWYWEVTFAAGSDAASFVGARPSPYEGIGGVVQRNGVLLGLSGAALPGWSNYTVIGVAMDCDAGTLAFYYNGVLQGGSERMITGWSAGMYLLPVQGNQVHTAHVNFGQQGFAYGPPNVFKALCTKNLPKPTNSAIVNPSSAFVAVTDTGANVQATLAAARSGWPSHIEIFKRRDASEGWRWRFSDDVANYLDSSSTAAKAEFPALSGSSYVGYALKVSAQNGVETGRLAHTSGVASIVTDGLANSRKVVILKNEATGNWFFYHPELTAGKLLYLNLTNAETTDATINSVTDSGFTVAAAMATGTYRWISLAEVDGCLMLTKHDANAAVDGPFASHGLSPAFSLFKKKIGAIAASGVVFDAARNPSNLTNLLLSLDTTAAEVTGTGTSIDQVSNGSKMRGAGLEINYASGYSYVSLHFASFPFRYSNAR